MTNPDDNEAELRLRDLENGKHYVRAPAEGEAKPPGPSGRAGGPVEDADRDAAPAPGDADPLAEDTGGDRRTSVYED